MSDVFCPYCNKPIDVLLEKVNLPIVIDEPIDLEEINVYEPGGTETAKELFTIHGIQPHPLYGYYKNPYKTMSPFLRVSINRQLIPERFHGLKFYFRMHGAKGDCGLYHPTYNNMTYEQLNKDFTFNMVDKRSYYIILTDIDRKYYTSHKLFIRRV